MNSKIDFPNDYVLHDVIICALRYALPRHTYAVEEILDSDYELHECDKHCIINLRWRLIEWNNKK